MNDIFKNKKILITGGTGSIGELTARELLKHEPSIIRIFDIDETRQFELQEELKDHSEKLRFLLGNVYDKERLCKAMENIDIVLHMAALKHVFSCEYNPFEAMKTNVIGTQNVIDVARDQEVEKVIFTSSDKAVKPFSVMGTTKLLSERLMTTANYYRGSKKTIFSSVRFGNVIGSRGSVVPLFKKQIEKGGPLTITNSNMTRFIMSHSQAISLLLKSTAMAQGGEIFIFKMLVVRPIDIAKTMISTIPSSNHKDIEIKTIGIKPGEKMYEELMTEEESERALETDDMFIILPETKELLAEINISNYNAKPAKPNNYSSNNIKPIAQKQILELLNKENLL